MSLSAPPSAGVYTSELDLSVRVKAASSSVGAVVGAAPRGPVGERVLITDNEAMRSIFGQGNPQRYGFMHYAALPFLKQSSRLYVTRMAKNALTAGAFLTVDEPSAEKPVLHMNVFDDGSNSPQGKDDPINTIGFNPGQPGVNNTLLFFSAANPGMWNNNLSIRIRPTNPKGVPVGEGHDTYQFFVDVFENYKGPRDIPQESFKCSRRVEVDGSGQQMFVEDRINKASNLIRVKNNPLCQDVAILEPIFEFLDGGTDGDALTQDDIVEGWELYRDVEDVSVNLLINGGYATPAVHRVMNDIAEERGDAFAILDLPSADYRVADAIRYRRNTLNLNSSYSALYGPEVQIEDETTNGKKIFVPLSGFAAAAYAFTDDSRELWFAPAGLQRGQLKVVGVRTTYNQGMRDAMDEAQINVVRFIRGKGYVIWGQETLQTAASAFSNVNVRRLVNFVKTSIAVASEPSVFDPNDEFLRKILANSASNFLDPIVRGRGLYEYKVICDDTNNTKEIIANGDIKLDVYIDPVIPAKRIHLTANVSSTGASFIEG